MHRKKLGKPSASFKLAACYLYRQTFVILDFEPSPKKRLLYIQSDKLKLVLHWAAENNECFPVKVNPNVNVIIVSIEIGVLVTAERIPKTLCRPNYNNCFLAN